MSGVQVKTSEAETEAETGAESYADGEAEAQCRTKLHDSTQMEAAGLRCHQEG